jgi:hypothetical protein
MSVVRTCFLVFCFCILLGVPSLFAKNQKFCSVIMSAVESPARHTEFEREIKSRWTTPEGIREILDHMSELETAEMIPPDDSIVAQFDYFLGAGSSAERDHREFEYALRFLHKIHLLQTRDSINLESLKARKPIELMTDEYARVAERLARGPRKKRYELFVGLALETLKNHPQQFARRTHMDRAEKKKIAELMMPLLDSDEGFRKLYDQSGDLIGRGFLFGGDFFGRSTEKVSLLLSQGEIMHGLADLYLATILDIFDKIHFSKSVSDADPRKVYSKQWLDQLFKLEVPKRARENLETKDFLERMMRFYAEISKS